MPKSKRLENIISVSNTIRIFKKRLKKEKRVKTYKAIQSIIGILEITLKDLRDAH